MLPEHAGLSFNPTIHMARHTFATTVTLTQGVPLETVSKMLGHKRITTTQIYAKITNDKIGQDMKALSEKLNGIFKVAVIRRNPGISYISNISVTCFRRQGIKRRRKKTARPCESSEDEPCGFLSPVFCWSHVDLQRDVITGILIWSRSEPGLDVSFEAWR